ncbi:MAG: membrane fusion protein LapC [Gammaproteobacteria bacterium]|nr:MAG: membrane fusion protein LapC [Gammaproteobacteria bacterium]TND07406.1 MAG: membrane fusion protein LapC [Gammaproteobacteria bacterium]
MRERFAAAFQRYTKESFSEAYHDDVEFMSDVNASTFRGTRAGSHLILGAAALFFIIALVWAAFATLDEVTTGAGKVIPSSKVQVVQNFEGGILQELLVAEGATVAKDQPLLRLDDTRFSSSFRETQQKYYDLLAQLARLTAESEGRLFEPPAEVVSAQPQTARNQQDLFQSRQHELQSKTGILKQQQEQKQQDLAELKARTEQLRRSYRLVEQELKISEPLVGEGVISPVEVLRLKRSVNDIKGELETASLSAPRLESAIAEANNKIEDAEITFRTQALAELNQVQADLSGVTEIVRAAQDRVTRTIVRSPVHGIVKQIKVTTVGGVVQPGMDLVEIVPLEDSLLVEANIRPADIAFLRPGQDAVVKFSAYDFSIYGGLDGELEHISADTIRADDAAGKGRGENYYVIRVRTRKSYLGPNADALRIIPGMTAMVDIKTGKKTVLDYLLKPVLKARERALSER